MDGWMDGWIGGWVDGVVDEWVSRWIQTQIMKKATNSYFPPILSPVVIVCLLCLASFFENMIIHDNKEDR
jgi:fructose-specific phosphotransferase system IIC component